MGVDSSVITERLAVARRTDSSTRQTPSNSALLADTLLVEQLGVLASHSSCENSLRNTVDWRRSTPEGSLRFTYIGECKFIWQ